MELKLRRNNDGLSLSNFLKNIDGSLKIILEKIREFVLKSFPDVSEDIRNHRIVYGKNDILRSFLDIRVLGSEIRILLYLKDNQDPREITKEHGNSWRYFTISSNEQLNDAFTLIKLSYESV